MLAFIIGEIINVPVDQTKMYLCRYAIHYLSLKNTVCQGHLPISKFYNEIVYCVHKILLTT